MSDVRHCDGPGCDKEAPLQEGDFIAVRDGGISSHYITLSRNYGEDLHFHRESCLTKWAAENTMAKG